MSDADKRLGRARDKRRMMFMPVDVDLACGRRASYQSTLDSLRGGYGLDWSPEQREAVAVIIEDVLALIDYVAAFPVTE